MLQLSAATRIYLAIGVTDMRKSFDTLCGIVRSWHASRLEALSRSEGQGHGQAQEPAVDPLDGSLYVFCNRRRDRIKVLYFDGLSLWVCASRLERGTYSWPTADEESSGQSQSQGAKQRCQISQQELAMLLGGVDMALTRPRRWWRGGS